MSWDVLVMKIPENYKSLSEMPKDYAPSPLGRFDEVLKVLKDLLPDIDLSDPSWGIFCNEKCSIEFSIGDDDPVTTIMLHIRGGEAPIDIIKTICEKTDWKAIDTSTGNVIDFKDNPEDSFDRWKRYRDKIKNEFR